MPAANPKKPAPNRTLVKPKTLAMLEGNDAANEADPLTSAMPTSTKSRSTKSRPKKDIKARKEKDSDTREGFGRPTAGKQESPRLDSSEWERKGRRYVPQIIDGPRRSRAHSTGQSKKRAESVTSPELLRMSIGSLVGMESGMAKTTSNESPARSDDKDRLGASRNSQPKTKITTKAKKPRIESSPAPTSRNPESDTTAEISSAKPTTPFTVARNNASPIPSKRTASDMQGELAVHFDTLQRLRMTEPERLLEAHKKSAEKQLEAADRLAQALKKENALLKEQIKAKLEHATTPKESGQNDFMKPGLLELYMDMSGVRIKELDENRWHCSLRGRHGACEFQLERLVGDGAYQYTPLFAANSPIAEHLPSYLREEIIFGKDQLQPFYWRALNFLMSSK